MSDVPHPNWWQASDGKWYPPESSPDVPMNRRDTWTTIPGSTFRKCLLCGEEFTYTHFTCRKRDPITGKDLPKAGELFADRVLDGMVETAGRMFQAVFKPSPKVSIDGDSSEDQTKPEGTGKRIPGYSTRSWPASVAETETVADLGRRAQKLTGRIEFLDWTSQPVVSGRELLLLAYEANDVGNSVELLAIAMKMLRRTSSLQIDDEALRMLEIEGASFWRGVIGGLLNDASTSFYFEINFADITALFQGGAIDQTTALRKMGRCNEERAEWLRFRGDPEASEKFRLAIKAYEGASLPDRARNAAAAQKSRAPAGPSSFLERKGPPSGGAILGSSSAYEFRRRLTNGS